MCTPSPTSSLRKRTHDNLRLQSVDEDEKPVTVVEEKPQDGYWNDAQAAAIHVAYRNPNVTSITTHWEQTPYGFFKEVRTIVYKTKSLERKNK